VSWNLKEAYHFVIGKKLKGPELNFFFLGWTVSVEVCGIASLPLLPPLDPQTLPYRDDPTPPL
jgi:hypothetical protein